MRKGILKIPALPVKEAADKYAILALTVSGLNLEAVIFSSYSHLSLSSSLPNNFDSTD